MRPFAAIALAVSLAMSGLAHAGVAIGDTPPDRLGNNQQGVPVRTRHIAEVLAEAMGLAVDSW